MTAPLILNQEQRKRVSVLSGEDHPPFGRAGTSSRVAAFGPSCETLDRRTSGLRWPLNFLKKLPPNYLVNLPTILLTIGATMATVGRAIGHVVIQLLNHCPANPE